MMKRSLKSMLGVTLLEIMLVLAIAAMVIVMSVRYYQSATVSQQTNAALQMVQSITAAVDGLAQGTGTYNNGNVVTDNVKLMMPNQSMALPWGGAATIGTTSETTYQVTFSNTPKPVCAQLKARLLGNNKYSTAATCATVGSFTYTYNVAAE